MTTPPTVLYAAVPGVAWDAGRIHDNLPPPRAGSKWERLSLGPEHKDYSPNAMVFQMLPFAGTRLCVAYRAHGATTASHTLAVPGGIGDAGLTAGTT